MTFSILNENSKDCRHKTAVPSEESFPEDNFVHPEMEVAVSCHFLAQNSLKFSGYLQNPGNSLQALPASGKIIFINKKVALGSYILAAVFHTETNTSGVLDPDSTYERPQPQPAMTSSRHNTIL